MTQGESQLDIKKNSNRTNDEEFDCSRETVVFFVLIITFSDVFLPQ